MSFSVYLTRRAERDASNLPSDLQKRAKDAIRLLASEPFLGHLLKGKFEGLRSYRVGTFRLVYSLDTRKKQLFIVKIGHRREIYR